MIISDPVFPVTPHPQMFNIGWSEYRRVSLGVVAHVDL